jgi:hypothetical protein
MKDPEHGCWPSCESWDDGDLGFGCYGHCKHPDMKRSSNSYWPKLICSKDIYTMEKCPCRRDRE